MSSALVSTGLRGNVERLLRDDIRVEDIRDLIFSMRAESGGSGLVSEIASFIAHPDVRTQGATWKLANDAFPIIRFWAWIELYPIVTRDVPDWIPDALRLNLSRVRKSVLRRWTGFNRAQASAVLERVLSRQIPTSEGRLSRIVTRSQQEADVINCAARFLKGGSLFTANDLFEDFCRALQKQQLLKAREKDILKRVKPAMTLFALATMHGRKIDLGESGTAKISIVPDLRGNLAAYVMAEVSEGYDGMGPYSAAIWVFETRLPVASYCEDGVAPTGRAPFIGEFEVTPDGKLGRRV